MHRSARNQKVVVLLGLNLIHIFLGVEHKTAFLSLTQVVDHRILVDTFFQSQIHHSILSGIQQIVALVLCIVHAEILADKLGGGMHLQTQIATAHGVEKVETNRKILAKTGLYRLTEQWSALQQHQIDRGQLETHAVHLEQQTVLLGHTVETPAEVGFRAVQVAHLFHPLAAPWSWVEERYHAEGRFRGFLDALKKGTAVNHLGFACDMGVQPPVDACKELVFVLVEYAPVDKQSAFVLDRHGILAVVNAQRHHLVPTESLLYLPAGHVHIHLQCVGRGHQAGANTNHYCRHCGCCQFVAGGAQFLFAEEIDHFQVGDVAKQHIVGHKRFGHLPDFLFGLHQVAGIDNLSPSRKSLDDLVFIHARI